MAERINAVINDVINSLSKGRLLSEEIERAWQDAALGVLKGHAKAAAFKDGRLLVTVDSSAWLYKAAFCKKELLDRLNDKLGDDRVKKIDFKIGAING